MARPIDIDALLDGLEASPEAKAVVGGILKTCGEMHLTAVAADLGVSPQYAHRKRREILQAALAAAEPKPLGRPPAPPPDPKDARIAELEQQVRDLTVEREIGVLREQLLAAGMGGKLKGLSKKHR